MYGDYNVFLKKNENIKIKVRLNVIKINLKYISVVCVLNIFKFLFVYVRLVINFNK